MIVFLVPIGHDRFELYSEVGDEPGAAPTHHDGRFRRWAHTVNVQWHQVVDTARHGRSKGRLARWRDAIVCRLSETIAEQRTLWALRSRTASMLWYPATITAERARAVLNAALEHARRHHLKWFSIDLALFVASGIFFFIPGPNLIAYYFAFRFIGHLQSWRGAAQGMDSIKWTLEPDAGLAELASLIGVPREARAPRVAAIAAKLNLPRLTAFFDRVAVSST
jgi:hypothetical protein